MIQRSTPRRVAAVVLAAGLLAAACSEQDDSDSSADEPAAASTAAAEPAEEPAEAATATTAAADESTETTVAEEPATETTVAEEPATETTETTEPTETTAPAEGFDATAIGLEYTGGPGGEASGDPYRIGFAHSSDFFPEGDVAADAAVEFINSELGGVGGRPLELVKCNVVTPEDSASCGAEFANDDAIDLIVGGLVLQAPADLYSAVAGSAAAIIATPLDASDYINPNAVSYNTGALGAGIGGAAYAVEDLQPGTYALVVTDDVAGRGGASVLTPIIESAGIEMKQVFVAPTATAPEIAAALQATGAETADVVGIGLFEQGCIAAYDALQSLGIEPEVVTTSVCWGNAMQDHLSGLGAQYPFPNNWTFTWFGYNPFVDDLEPTIEAYLTVMDAYGDAGVSNSVAAPIIFDAIMSAAKVINDIGVDNASFDTLDAGVRGFTGPSMIQSGPQECGIAPYISVCASEVSAYTFRDGEWIPQRSAPGGNPIDISPYTRPG